MDYVKFMTSHPLLRAYEDHLRELALENAGLHRSLANALLEGKEVSAKLEQAEKAINDLSARVEAEIEDATMFTSAGKSSRGVKEAVLETFRDKQSEHLRQIGEGRKRAAELEEEKKTMLAYVQELEHQAKESARQAKDSQVQLEEALAKCKLLKDRLELKEKEVKVIQDERVVFATIKDKMNSDMAKLKLLLEDEKTERQRIKNSADHRAKEYEITVKTLTDEKEIAERTLNSKTQDFKKSNEANNELAQEIIQLKENIRQMAKALEEYEASTQKSEIALEDLKEKNKKNKLKIEELLQQADKATVKERQYQQQIEDLQQKLKQTAESARSENSSAMLKLELRSKAEVGEVGRKFSEAAKELRELRREHEELEGKYDVLRKQKDAVEMRATEEHSADVRKAKCLEEAIKAVKEDADSEKKELESKLLELKVRIKDVELKCKEAELEASFLKRQLKEETRKAEELSAENERMRGDLDKVRKQLMVQENDYGRKVQSLSADYESTVQKLKAENAYYSGRLTADEDEIRLLLRQEEALCSKWRTDYYNLNKYHEDKAKQAHSNQ